MRRPCTMVNQAEHLASGLETEMQCALELPALVGERVGWHVALRTRPCCPCLTELTHGTFHGSGESASFEVAEKVRRMVVLLVAPLG
jgi:hypothetical protein